MTKTEQTEQTEQGERAPKARRGDFAMLTRKTGWLGKETETFEVRVMARAEGYAMVRRKGFMPFVCCEAQLSPSPGA